MTDLLDVKSMVHENLIAEDKSRVPVPVMNDNKKGGIPADWSSSDDDSDKDEDLDRDLDKLYHKMKSELEGLTGNRDMGSDMEEEGGDHSVKYHTKNEKKAYPSYYDEEDPVKRMEKMNISPIDPSEKLIEVGEIYAILPDTMIIEGNTKLILNLDNFVVMNKEIVLGLIEDVFGNIKKPFYRLTLDKFLKKMTDAQQISKGTTVYAVDRVKKVVHNTDIIKMMHLKGCDASNKFDEENLEDGDKYYSDDDEEAAAKTSKKKNKKKKDKEPPINRPPPQHFQNQPYQPYRQNRDHGERFQKRKDFQRTKQNNFQIAKMNRAHLAYNPFLTGPQQGPAQWSNQPPTSFIGMNKHVHLSSFYQQPPQYQQQQQYQQVPLPPQHQQAMPGQHQMVFTSFIDGQPIQNRTDFYAPQPTANTAANMPPSLFLPAQPMISLNNGMVNFTQGQPGQQVGQVGQSYPMYSLFSNRPNNNA